MKLIYRIFARADRRRAREYLQQVCDDRVQALRKAAEAKRLADRALADAKALEMEHFRQEFFGRRDRVKSAFTPCNPWVCLLPQKRDRRSAA